MPLRFLSCAAAALFSAAGTVAAQSAAAAPAPVSDTLKFASVTVGGAHACGLTAEGKAYCWGKNDVGQLGDSTTIDRPSPVPVVGGLTFRMLSAGARHTCGISTDDDPYCWGGNESGQLGDGSRANLHMPYRIGGDLRVAQISAGGQHTCATQIHWDKQDRAVCWGSNKFGQLGDMSPVDASSPVETFGVIRYVSIATGAHHSCGATRQGKVFCWGANNRGQLGNAGTTLSQVPFPIRMNRKVTITKVTAGADHTCALSSEGEVFCWGENEAGQIGNGKAGKALAPTGLRDAESFTAIAAGGNETCGIRVDGTASCWGSNASGALGPSAVGGARIPTPALAGNKLTAIVLGAGRGCALRADGETVCWGQTTPAGSAGPP
jgi:alpha-tubulin suppressor-like RCC1 family protein